MNSFLIRNLTRIVRRIENDTACCSDIALLFSLLRYGKTGEKRCEPLFEIGSCFAHPEGKDQGESYKLIRDFGYNLIKFSKEGGTISGNKPPFEKLGIIRAIIHQLQINNIPFDEQIIISKKEIIIDCLIELLDGHPFVFKNELKKIGYTCVLKKRYLGYEKKLSLEVKPNIEEVHFSSKNATIIPGYLFD